MPTRQRYLAAGALAVAVGVGLFAMTLLPISRPPAPTAPAAAPSGPTAEPAGDTQWPGPENTGVPPGTVLEAYTGSCDIRNPGFVIEARIVECEGILIYAADVVIRNSIVRGPVRTNSPEASVLIEDSEIDGRQAQSEAVGYDNVTVLRSNVYGNQHTVHCGSNCRVEDSWLHDQFDGTDLGWHQNGFITNGGRNIVLRGNRIECVGGCTADVALIPDDDISDVLVERNLFVASPDSSYCVHGGGHSGGKPGTATRVVFRDNVFQRGENGLCGFYGPVTYFQEGAGNEWSGNVFEDGAQVPAAF